MIFAKILAATIWAVVGIIFWIPLLLRAFTLTAILLILAAVSDSPNSASSDRLLNVVKFYPNGFRRIFEKETGRSTYHSVALRRVLQVSLFSALFYLFSLVFYSIFFGVPNWFTAKTERGNLAGNEVPTLPNGQVRDLEIPFKNLSQELSDENCSTGWRCAPRAMVDVKNVSADTGSSDWININSRICNTGKIEFWTYVDVYYTDEKNNTVNWPSFTMGWLKPGACLNYVEQSKRSVYFSNIDFSKGTFFFNLSDSQFKLNISQQ